jgi:hypothetical protein
MKYTINYKGKTPSDALLDCKEYLGEEKFNKLVNYLASTDLDLEELHFVVRFLGIDGFPAKAMTVHILQQR